VSGSNAAFSYTPQSDIDLHLVVDFPSQDDVYQELFNAKKYQYNDEHTLSIGKIPVELYVQNAAETPVSQGEYSVMNDRWIQVPRKKRARIDDTCVRAKVEDLDARIHSAIQSGDADAMGRLWDKIRNMRQSGLDQHGTADAKSQSGNLDGEHASIIVAGIRWKIKKGGRASHAPGDVKGGPVTGADDHLLAMIVEIHFAARVSAGGVHHVERVCLTPVDHEWRRPVVVSRSHGATHVTQCRDVTDTQAQGLIESRDLTLRRTHLGREQSAGA
jgi:hypothetical protein